MSQRKYDGMGGGLTARPFFIKFPPSPNLQLNILSPLHLHLLTNSFPTWGDPVYFHTQPHPIFLLFPARLRIWRWGDVNAHTRDFPITIRDIENVLHALPFLCPSPRGDVGSEEGVWEYETVPSSQDRAVRSAEGGEVGCCAVALGREMRREGERQGTLGGGGGWGVCEGEGGEEEDVEEN